MTQKDQTKPQELDKKLGKIKEVNFGHVHDRNFLLGLNITFEGQSWGVSSGFHFNVNPDCRWENKEQRNKAAFEILERLDKILVSAKVNSVEELKGKPVEVTFKNMLLVDWRILEEVL